MLKEAKINEYFLSKMSRRVKKSLFIILVYVLLLAAMPEQYVSALALSPPEEETEERVKIKLNKDSVSLKRGEKFQLIAEVIPGTYSKAVQWRSSDPLIASVDGNGLVTTFNKYGVVYIRAMVGHETVYCHVYIPPEEDYYTTWKDGKSVANKVLGKTLAQYNVFPVKAAAGGKGRVKISWKKQKKVKQYELQRAKTRGGKYKTIAKRKKAKYTDKAVKAGTGYKYRVCSVGTDGKRRYSSVVKVRTSGTPAASEKPDPPSHVEAKLYDSSVVRLKWAKAERADGYCVYRRAEDSNRYKLVKVVCGNKKTKWFDQKLKFFCVYEYKVAAFWNRKGKRVYSKKSYPVFIRTHKGENPKILNAEGLKIRLKGKDVTKKKKEMNLCSKAYAKVTFDPEYLYYEDQRLVSDRVIWSSSDKSILKVNGRGVITSGTKEGYCTIYARAHNGITKSVKIKVVNYANPVRFPQYGSGVYDINRLLTSYRSEVQDIMTYFTIYGKKGESGTIRLYENIFGEHELIGIPALKKISLVEKKIRKIITEFPMLVEISYDYNEVTFEISYSADSYERLTYSKVDRFDKNRWQMAPHWKYYRFVPI